MYNIKRIPNEMEFEMKCGVLPQGKISDTQMKGIIDKWPQEVRDLFLNKME